MSVEEALGRVFTDPRAVTAWTWCAENWLWLLLAVGVLAFVPWGGRRADRR